MLGYRGNAKWRDLSEYVVHFTKDANGGQSAYTAMLSILHSGILRAGGPFGAARGLSALGDSQRSVCFSEIPLDRLDRLVERRSRYGVAFKQDVVIKAGGGRVWYLDDDGDPARALRRMVSNRAVPGMDLEDLLWTLTPFVDFPSDAYAYRFEWEREWRVPSDLKFEPQDVAFLFLPEELHDAARAFFAEHERENTGPHYECPFLDPRWTDERLQAVFAAAAI